MADKSPGFWDYVRSALPTLTGAMDSVGSDIDRYSKQGDYGRAAGAAARGLVTYPAGFVNDVVAPPVKFIGHALAGAVGYDGGSAGGQPELQPVTAPVKNMVKAVKAPAAPVRIPVGSTATLQERQAAMLNAMFRRPLTMGEAAAATGMMPAVKPMTQSDVLAASGAQAAERVRASQMAAAAQETDPAKRAALEQSAYEKYLNYMATLAGKNPYNAAQANMLPTMSLDQ